MHMWINPDTQHLPEPLHEFIAHSPVMLVMLSFLGVATLVVVLSVI